VRASNALVGIARAARVVRYAFRDCLHPASSLGCAGGNGLTQVELSGRYRAGGRFPRSTIQFSFEDPARF
jgi:hypothetical protein